MAKRVALSEVELKDLINALTGRIDEANAVATDNETAGRPDLAKGMHERSKRLWELRNKLEIKL